MMQIPDCPIIRSMESTGYPPWMDADWEECETDAENESMLD